MGFQSGRNTWKLSDMSARPSMFPFYYYHHDWSCIHLDYKTILNSENRLELAELELQEHLAGCTESPHLAGFRNTWRAELKLQEIQFKLCLLIYSKSGENLPAKKLKKLKISSNCDHCKNLKIAGPEPKLLQI